MSGYIGPNIIADSSLLLDLDVSNPLSYVSGSLTWSNLANSNNNFIFTGSQITYSPTNSFGTLTTDFSRVTPYSQSYFIQLTSPQSELLAAPFGEHTIEVVINTNTFTTVYSVDNSLTGEAVSGIFTWQGNYSGLVFNTGSQNIIYRVYDSASNSARSASVNGSPYRGSNVFIQGMRRGNSLYLFVNETLQNTTSSTFTSSSYTNINIGNLNPGLPTLNNLVGASNISYYTIRVYNRALSNAELSQSYNSVKTRFGLT